MNHEIGIIGAKGTVGKTLLSQYKNEEIFPHQIIRENFEDSSKNYYKTLIVCCFDARKYIVDKDPFSDLENINYIYKTLKKYSAEKVILISTVDVYQTRKGNELTLLNHNKAGYSFNRYLCELYLREVFEKTFIIRLQGLVGVNIKKNMVFDLKFDNSVEKVNRNLKIQYYPLIRLMKDLKNIINKDIKLVNLSCEPLSINDISEFIKVPNYYKTNNNLPDQSKNYNVKSIYSEISKNGNDDFWVCKEEIIKYIKLYFNKSWK